MWFLLSSAQIAVKRDSMRAAEAKLLELAHRFARGGSSTESNQPETLATSDYHMELFDTTIPRSSVPCLKIGGSDDDDRQDLVIHGIHVTSNTVQGDESKAIVTSKTPLVMLHGYMNSSAYFYRNLLGLASYFTNIYSLDMLGWGLSSRPSFSLMGEANDAQAIASAESFFVDSLEAWRAEKKIDKMILAGHSMGGYLSVAYCEKYPERVERLILLSPVGVPEDSEDAKQRRQEILRKAPWRAKFYMLTFQYLFDHHTVGEIIRTMPKEMGFRRMAEYVEKRIPAISDPEEREAVTSYLYYNSILPGSGEYCVNRILNSNVIAKSPLVHRIPNLKVIHISFLYGDRDWMQISGGLDVQRTCVQKQRDGETAPNVNVYKVRDAGHLLMLDNWQEFNAGVILSAGWTKEALGNDYPIPMEESYLPGMTKHGSTSSSTPTTTSNTPEVSPVV